METEEEIEYLILSRRFGDHMIAMLVLPDDENETLTNITASCRDCQRHTHMNGVDFNNEEHTTMLSAEFQLHAAGVNDGWADGYGFDMED